MKIQVKKRNVIIAVAILLVVIIGVVATIFVIPNMKISQTHKKLSEINAEELETKIIQKLETSPINVSTSSISTTFKVNNEEPSGTGILYEASAKSYKFINISIKGTITEFISIDCCKIESNDNGTVKSIEFIEPSVNSGECDLIAEIVYDTIKNVLETEYNIDTSIISSLRYKNNPKIKFSFNKDEKTIVMSDYEWGVTVLKTISNNSDKSFNEKTYNNEVNDSLFERYYFNTTKISI